MTTNDLMNLYLEGLEIEGKPKLYEYHTGIFLRSATPDEKEKSRANEPTGVIQTYHQGRIVSAWVDDTHRGPTCRGEK